MGTTAIVAGGTGLVGRELIRLLQEDPRYDRIIALVRRDIKSVICGEARSWSKCRQTTANWIRIWALRLWPL